MVSTEPPDSCRENGSIREFALLRLHSYSLIDGNSDLLIYFKH